jgi:hypothetical protein
MKVSKKPAEVVVKTRSNTYTIDYVILKSFGMHQQSTGPIKVEGLTVTWGAESP